MFELAGSSGAVRVISKLVTFVYAVLTVSIFFSNTAGKTIASMYFLALFYCSGQLIYCVEISENKNNKRTIWDWNRQTIKNNPASAESFRFLYKKECVSYISADPKDVAGLRVQNCTKFMDCAKTTWWENMPLKTGRHRTRWRPKFQSQSSDFTYWKSARLPTKESDLGECHPKSLVIFLATAVFWGGYWLFFFLKLGKLKLNCVELTWTLSHLRVNKPVSQSCAERASRCFCGPHVPPKQRLVRSAHDCETGFLLSGLIRF